MSRAGKQAEAAKYELSRQYHIIVWSGGWMWWNTEIWTGSPNHTVTV